MSNEVAERVREGIEAQSTRALPGFDEFILGHKDRSIHVAPEHSDVIVPGGNGVFRSTIRVDGHVISTWTRTKRRVPRTAGAADLTYAGDSGGGA